MKRALVSLSILALIGARSVRSQSDHVDYYLHGERDLGRPYSLKVGERLPVHLAIDEYETLLVRLPAQARNPKTGLAVIDSASLKIASAPGLQIEMRSYAIATQKLKRSSFGFFAPGETPEIVIPSSIAAKPGFKIPRDNQPTLPLALFELHALEGAKAGTYDAEITLVSSGKEYRVPLKIRVFSTRLPKKFHLKTSFGFSPWSVLKKHYGQWDKGELDLYARYFQLATEHRIDLHKIYLKFPDEKKVGDPKAASYDPLTTAAVPALSFLGQWTPLKDRWSSTDLPVSEKEKTEPKESFWRDLNKSVLKNGLASSTYVYFEDEPKPEAIAGIKKRLSKIHTWAPDLSFLLTTHYQASLDGLVQIWCPNLSQWDTAGFPSPEFYRKRQKEKKEQLWLYTSCDAHGCTGAQDLRIPDLVTDRPSVSIRAFPWAAYRYGADGILYYNTVEGYGHSPGNPWEDPFLFTGNGEGNLFYPCGPKDCGVEEQNVLTSLRMKVLRDGLEDVEILKAAEEKGIPVQDWVKEKMPNSRSIPSGIEVFETLKIRALERMESSR